MTYRKSLAIETMSREPTLILVNVSSLKSHRSDEAQLLTINLNDLRKWIVRLPFISKTLV